MRNFSSSLYDPARGSEDAPQSPSSGRSAPAPTLAATPVASAPESAAGQILAARLLLAGAKGFVVDLDGTLVSGNHVIAGARELLDHARERYVIVSNNSRDTEATLARKLARLGLRVEPERIVLAGQQAVLLMLEQYPQARVRIVASPALTHFATSLGANVVEHDPDVILLGRDVHFGYMRLKSIANQLRRGAKLMVANPDLNHPAADGGVTPETGSLMNAVIACAGIEPTCVVGKPEPLLFREALRRLGTDAASTLVIGDNPLTDGAGARQLAMQCLLVGRHVDAHLESLALLFRQDEATRRFG
ncbi:HAD-IIA family hydrolase [Paraburkholderia fungorum]|uniref:HAD-IIA family hydrolase n=1 Tax=Paraburkholderia fungorum TaxID=134537 RepID=UPI0038BC027A